MKLQKIRDIVNGTLINEFQDTPDFTKAFASDLMSDLLRYSMENTVLITGLSTIQTIRTAEISNLTCLIITRDKKVSSEMKALASKSLIFIISTLASVYEISGLLFKNGIKPKRCIDCGECFRVCPQRAIYARDDGLKSVEKSGCRIALVPSVFIG